METIYLSMRAQVAVGTFFMKSPVREYVNHGGPRIVLYAYMYTHIYNFLCNIFNQEAVCSCISIFVCFLFVIPVEQVCP